MKRMIFDNIMYVLCWLNMCERSSATLISGQTIKVYTYIEDYKKMYY